MTDFLLQFNPVTQALFATLFTWGVTAAGAALVFFTKTINQKFMDSTLGFAAGVMIAASFWSLLSPGIQMAEQLGQIPWLSAVIGFMGGGIFMRVIDKFLPHLHPGLATNKAEGVKTSWQRSTLLVLAITLHNIPEGLAVGVAFGAVGAGLPSATLGGAIALAIGIGIQNFPEGSAVSMPLRREGMPKGKKFFYGAGFRGGGTHCRGVWRIVCDEDAKYFALCVMFCRRRHDFCCCGRTDSRIPKKA